MELLRTDRLLLRHCDKADLAAFFDLYSRDEVVRRLGAHPRRPLAAADEARERLARWREHGRGLARRSACGRSSRRRRPSSRPEPRCCSRSATTTGRRA
jgi:RimJ/RimL family protein N-acetyltransferase